MMVNTWNIKIATKLARVTALEGVTGKLDISIRQLSSEIVGHKTKLAELTQHIELKMKDINDQDRKKQKTIDELEILITKISGEQRNAACKGGVARNLIKDMTTIQTNIDRIQKAQLVEKSLFIQISTFMKDSHTIEAWEAGMRLFSDKLGDFMRKLQEFEAKARDLWVAGAWDRNALTGFRSSLQRQAQELKAAWGSRSHAMLFTKLQTLDNALMKSVVAGGGSKTSSLNSRFKEKAADKAIITRLDKNGNKITKLRFEELGAFEGVPMSQVNRELVK